MSVPVPLLKLLKGPPVMSSVLPVFTWKVPLLVTPLLFGLITARRLIGEDGAGRAVYKSQNAAAKIARAFDGVAVIGQHFRILRRRI